MSAMPGTVFPYSAPSYLAHQLRARAPFRIVLMGLAWRARRDSNSDPQIRSLMVAIEATLRDPLKLP